MYLITYDTNIYKEKREFIYKLISGNKTLKLTKNEFKIKWKFRYKKIKLIINVCVYVYVWTTEFIMFNNYLYC